jgi:hypothetical protein
MSGRGRRTPQMISGRPTLQRSKWRASGQEIGESRNLGRAAIAAYMSAPARSLPTVIAALIGVESEHCQKERHTEKESRPRHIRVPYSGEWSFQNGLTHSVFEK